MVRNPADLDLKVHETCLWSEASHANDCPGNLFRKMDVAISSSVQQPETKK